MSYTFKNVKTRYFFSGLVICLVSLLLASVSGYLISLRITSQQAKSGLRESALRNTAELDSWFGNFSSILNNAVEDLEINGRYDSEYLQHMLSAKMARNTDEIFDLYIGLEAPDQPLISAIGWVPPSTYDPRERPWYTKARETRSTIFTKPYMDAQTGKMVITIARKITKNGKLYGVMAADVFIAKVLDKVQRYSLSEHSYAFLLDNESNFVSHPDPALQPVTNGLTNLKDLNHPDYVRLLESTDQDLMPIRRGKDLSGSPAYFMMSRIPANNWVFGISIPVADYRKPLRLLLEGFTAAVLVSLLISTFIMLHLVDTLAKPIHALTRTIGSFSGTALDVRAEVRSRDEIGELGTIFNTMADTIQEYSRSLERKVEERTLEVRRKSLRIHESIEYAKTIQEAIMPDEVKLSDSLNDHFVIWEPKDTVGGDFYWFKAFRNGFVVVVGDCTGHGVPGALMTMAATSLLDRIITEERHDDPATILSDLNRLLDQTLRQEEGRHIEDGLDAGILYLSRDLDRALFSGAGLSVLISDGSEIREIKGNRQGIGFSSLRRGTVFNLHELRIRHGMSFYMATDGIRDQIGEKTGLPFGRTRLKDLLTSLQHHTMADQKDLILQALKTHRGIESVRDDITLFGFRI